MMIGGGENDEIISAPAVAEVARRYYGRPLSLASDPIEIESDLWHQAHEELKSLLGARGWTLVTSEKARLPNFLLHGVPVVMLDG